MYVRIKRLVLAAVIIALFAAGCGAQKAGSDKAGADLPVASIRGIDNEGRGLEVGQPAPDLFLGLGAVRHPLHHLPFRGDPDPLDLLPRKNHSLGLIRFYRRDGIL